MLLGLIDSPLVYAEMFVDKYIWNGFQYVLVSPVGLSILGTMMWLCVGVILSYMLPWFVRMCVDRARKEDEGNRIGQ
jgi:hypothetical protein